MCIYRYYLCITILVCVILHPLQSFVSLRPFPSKSIFTSQKRPNKLGTQLHGIPRLFRWIVDLYPMVVESINNLGSKADTPMDNFYLDMNGIIHTCTHSNDDQLVEFNELNMFQKIFTYTDNLYKLVKPSKLMYIAVDGVAPRAKMNQQRSRRFRSSKEREILLAEYVAKEGKLPDEESFDSNCITPGTQFMHRLSIAFRSWIQYKMKSDQFWRENGATVAFSGPDVPGEGEHKIMDKIRALQNDPLYKPGLRHCMYGLDADLIMLSMATHEPNFVLLREKMFLRAKRVPNSQFQKDEFELLEVKTLRKVLSEHFKTLKSGYFPPLRAITAGQYTSSLNSKTNFIPQKITNTSLHEQRVIDDFIFMCFFIGNDFLPRLPHMDIADGSLNLMMDAYRELFPVFGGYLTDKDKIHLPRVELFLKEISRREAMYFQHRSSVDLEPEYATPQYRDHYYKCKFGIEPGDEEAIKKIVEEYVLGLVWVLTYYHKGCGSWTWYYPYFYAPLASDFINIHTLNLSLSEGVPFTPLLQLLSVLPPQSGKFLPVPYEELMTTPGSPLDIFYPMDFEVDANGKVNSWECIVKIPFIEENVLLDTISAIDHNTALSDVEKARNIRGVEFSHSPNTSSILNITESQSQTQKRMSKKRLKQSQWGDALQASS